MGAVHVYSPGVAATWHAATPLLLLLLLLLLMVLL